MQGLLHTKWFQLHFQAWYLLATPEPWTHTCRLHHPNNLKMPMKMIKWIKCELVALNPCVLDTKILKLLKDFNVKSRSQGSVNMMRIRSCEGAWDVRSRKDITPPTSSDVTTIVPLQILGELRCESLLREHLTCYNVIDVTQELPIGDPWEKEVWWQKIERWGTSSALSHCDFWFPKVLEKTDLLHLQQSIAAACVLHRCILRDVAPGDVLRGFLRGVHSTEISNCATWQLQQFQHSEM